MADYQRGNYLLRKIVYMLCKAVLEWTIELENILPHPL